MTIREEFDYTFVDPHRVMFCLEARIGRGNEDLWLRLLSPASDKVIVVKPTRKQWLEFRATLNHVLDAEDVTAISAVEAKEATGTWPPNTAEQKATFERWLDKHSLDDTDLNDPPPEEVT